MSRSDHHRVHIQFLASRRSASRPKCRAAHQHPSRLLLHDQIRPFQRCLRQSTSSNPSCPPHHAACCSRRTLDHFLDQRPSRDHHKLREKCKRTDCRHCPCQHSSAQPAQASGHPGRLLDRLHYLARSFCPRHGHTVLMSMSDQHRDHSQCPVSRRP